VLRVLYGYLMACEAAEIPLLSFPRDEIVEIIPSSYENVANRIAIPDLPPETIPGSPEGVAITVPPSGTITPLSSGMLTPRKGQERGRPLSFAARMEARDSSAHSEAGLGTAKLMERLLLRKKN
jgi:6-phosphofructo-2-kinase / fructose-2,6-biphosphatase 4